MTQIQSSAQGRLNQRRLNQRRSNQGRSNQGGDRQSTGLPAPWDGLSLAYRHWRAERLQRYRLSQGVEATTTQHRLSPELEPARPSATIARLCESVRLDGFALYEWDRAPIDLAVSVHRLNLTLHLSRFDTGVLTQSAGLSLLQDMQGTPQGRFIPYSRRAMNWHTDGYYNSPLEEIRCFSLHCVEPAHDGGALTLMDTELLFIALVDDDPELVSILSHPQAMLLPANTDAEGHRRPDRHVPMIFIHADGTLGMRFTARVKNISWRTPDTQAAAQRALDLIEQHGQYQTTIRLTHRQGVITRNILHRREAFNDSDGGPKRQMWRGRYSQLPRHQFIPDSSAPGVD